MKTLIVMCLLSAAWTAICLWRERELDRRARVAAYRARLGLRLDPRRPANRRLGHGLGFWLAQQHTLN